MHTCDEIQTIPCRNCLGTGRVSPFDLDGIIDVPEDSEERTVPCGTCGGTGRIQQWETIYDDSAGSTARLQVPGGWIYERQVFGGREDTPPSVGLVFVPSKESEGKHA